MKTFGDLNSLLEDFQKVVALAGVSLSPAALSFEAVPAPHKPPSGLPNGKAAVYVFIWNGLCLKVGKVGPKSHARYTSQHYNPASSNSNLAKSLVAGHEKICVPTISDGNVGEWIKNNVDRVNFLLSVECGIPVLTLLESFLQCRLKPVFEGFESQR
jgi:hypothetical protein